MSHSNDDMGTHASHRAATMTAEDRLEDADDLPFAGHPTRRHHRHQSILVPILVMALAVAGVIVSVHTVKPLRTLLGVCQVTDRSVVIPPGRASSSVSIWTGRPRRSRSTAQTSATHPASRCSSRIFLMIAKPGNTQRVPSGRFGGNGSVLLLTLEPHAGLDDDSPRCHQSSRLRSARPEHPRGSC